MNIHEHQAKASSEFGVAVPRGYPAFTVEVAVEAAEQLGGPARGEVADPRRRARQGPLRGWARRQGRRPGRQVGRRREGQAQEMLGRVLVTHQTGPKGKQVNRLYIEEGAAIARELYLSLLVDRETSRVSVVASTEGGMSIEDVAHDTPEKITTFSIDPATGVWGHHARALSNALGLSGALAKEAATLLNQLYKALSTGHVDAGDHADRHR
jgi:succinyl-CoA synthetase beta subunit